jgi:peptidoglycan/LPS O-acetylase OafA/YrhL
LKERFAFIDGLRGIAALWVVCMHFQTLILERSTAIFSSFTDTVLKQGHVGVNIFFILSGFVIAYSIRSQIISVEFIGKFFIRRSIRLDPPYWLTLIVLTGIIMLGPFFLNKGHEYVPSMSDFFFNVFYLQNFAEVRNILPVAWTLCLEIQLYLILVFFLWLIQRVNLYYDGDAFNYYSKFGFIFLNLIFFISLLQASHLLPAIIPGLFLPSWYNFFMGSLLCWVLLKYISDLQILIAFSLMALFSFIESGHDILTTLILSLGMYFCIRANKLHTFLSSSVFQFFGKISYSIYLIHWPLGIKFISVLAFVLGSSIDKIPAVVLLVFSTGICVAASELFYRYVEYPFIKISRKASLSVSHAKVDNPQPGHFS